MKILPLIFEKLLCSKQLNHFTFSLAMYEDSYFSTSLPTWYCLFVFIITILVGKKWYFTAVSICISIMTNDSKHLLFLYGYLYSFLEKCLSNCFAHVLIRLSFYYLIIRVLYSVHKSFVRYMNCKYTLEVCMLSFNF